jgi:uncharacterized repeat protein (TIGR03803 family)
VAPAHATTEEILYSLPAGSYAYGSLVQDSKGALYGTAADLGGSGAIYRLKQQSSVWVFKILHQFGGSDGDGPFAGLTEDHAHKIFYGVTDHGGSDDDGAIFTIAPQKRSWSEKVLYSFFGTSDGAEPEGVLAQDADTGDLYGTTIDGGSAGCGAIFQLSKSSGTWSLTTLHSFSGGSDGCRPLQLRMGPKRNTMVGITISDNGTVFELKKAHGTWSYSVIHSFGGGEDGVFPYDLDIASDGTVYGVTDRGGIFDDGVAFELTPRRKGWSYKLLYTFTGGTDGNRPVGITFDERTGTVYGTTTYGGTSGFGTLFKLVRNGDSWDQTVLHSFSGGSDGADPESRPIVDQTTGSLYGTTIYGGSNDGGTVYMVEP